MLDHAIEPVACTMYQYTHIGLTDIQDVRDLGQRVTLLLAELQRELLLFRQLAHGAIQTIAEIVGSQQLIWRICAPF